ncbi:hypothetical protein CLOM_g6761 [Closterium sp. NIES-68]|nr:hypothetical protein CLOM_g6761 [Closterium sp. NIES-68]
MAEHTLDIPPETPPHLQDNHIITNPMGSNQLDLNLNRDMPEGAPPTFQEASGLPTRDSSPPPVSPRSLASPPHSPPSAGTLSPPLSSPSLLSPHHSTPSSLCFHNISYSVPIGRHPLAFLPAIPSLCSSTVRSSSTAQASTNEPPIIPQHSLTGYRHKGNSVKQQQQQRNQQQQYPQQQQRGSILQRISGCAKAGQVTAIMGASGSGKTSLLDILSHRISLPSTPHHMPSPPHPTAPHALRSPLRGVQGNPEGSQDAEGMMMKEPPTSISLNGAPVSASTMRRVSAYVMQDDLLFPALTVRETLMFAAELRLPAGEVTRQDKEKRVNDLMRLLGLTRVADSRIGDENRRGVSGGERKRVAIGVEMVGDPMLLFLDEPTSGLDSTCAFHVVKAVRDVARLRQSIVLMVLHQPSFRVLNLLDNLILLGSGHTMFSGCPSELPGYLTDFGCPPPPYSNPVEFALDLIQSLQKEGEQDGQEGGQELQEVRLKRKGLQDGQAEATGEVKEQTQANGGAGTHGIQRLAEFHREWVEIRSRGAGVKAVTGKPGEAAEQDDGLGEQEGGGETQPSAPHPSLSSVSLSSVGGLGEGTISSLGGLGGLGRDGGRSRRNSGSDTASLELVTSSSNKSSMSTSSSSTSVDSASTSSSSTEQKEQEKQEDELMIEKGEKEERREQGSERRQGKYANGWWRELWVLTARSAIVIRRTPALYLLRLLLIMITGLLTASLFWHPEYNTRGVHERLAFIAFLACTLFFSSGDATPLFIQERNIFVRETTHNAYRPSTYLVASTLVYLPLHLLMALAITLEAWWCLSLTGGTAGLAFMVLVCFCCLFTGNAIATFVSATVNNVILAYAVVITVLANFALVCGFYIERASIPLTGSGYTTSLL